MTRPFKVPRITSTEGTEEDFQSVLDQVARHLEASEAILEEVRRIHLDDGMLPSTTAERAALSKAHSQQATALLLYAAVASGD